MHGGDARKDERKAAASCARETVSPYDLGTPLPRDYPYDPRGRRLADGALATVILLRVAAAALAFAGLAWCAIWWAATSLGAAITAILCITLSALVLGRGLEYAAGAAFGRASLRLEPNVRHDYVLRVFRKGRRSAGTTPRFLLALARLDILRGQPRLAGDALARVDTSNLNPNRLKLLYLLQAVTAIQLQEDAHNAVIRYAGITGEKNAGFPPDNVVLGWAQDAADGRAPEDVTMRDVCASALQPRRHKPLLAVSLSVMLAHCLLFAGVATGVDATDSWRLRLGYQTVAGLLTSTFMVALAMPRKRVGARSHKSWARALWSWLSLVLRLLSLLERSSRRMEQSGSSRAAYGTIRPTDAHTTTSRSTWKTATVQLVPPRIGARAISS